MASPPVEKQKIFQSNFLVKHNLLPSFLVKDCDLKQWIMKPQESTSHYSPLSVKAETDGVIRKEEIWKRSSF